MTRVNIKMMLEVEVKFGIFWNTNPDVKKGDLL